MKNSQLVIGAVVVAVVIAGVMMYRQQPRTLPTNLVVDNTQGDGGGGEGQAGYTWKFFTSEPDSAGKVQTSISLMVGDVVYPIGTYDGTCAEQTTDMLPGEQSKVICWFAGAGDEIGVFIENNKTVVKVGELGEGEEGAAGFRGNFKFLMPI